MSVLTPACSTSPRVVQPKQDDKSANIREEVNQLVKMRQHTTNYKVESRNSMLGKFREEIRMIISNWGGGWGIKEAFVEEVHLNCP